jgi:gliding motility-associated-like protein
MKRIICGVGVSLVLVSSIVAQNSWSVEYGDNRCFIENKGQFFVRKYTTPDEVKFAFDGHTQDYYFTKEGVYFEFSDKRYRERTADEKQKRKARKGEGFESLKEWQDFQKQDKVDRFEEKREVIKVTWIDANPHVRLIGESVNTATHSYSFLSNGNMVNESGLKSYNRIVYKDMYPKIDVIYDMHAESGIKYSLILHPGANPEVIQLTYSKDFSLDKKGRIIIPTEFGNIIDHAPITFYEENGAEIHSKFEVNEGVISFKLSGYDPSKKVVIDPWTQTPNFNTNWKSVWECEKDAAGNVYIIGGVMPLQLLKYDAAGALQWTYNTPYDTTMWLGGFSTDNNGNSYVCNGSSAKIQCVSTGGTLVWDNPNPGGIFSGAEFWNISFNCDQTKLIVGGTSLPILSTNPTPFIYEVNMTNGNIINGLQVTGSASFGFSEPSGHEVRALTACDNGKYYFMTHDTLGYIHSNFTACGGGGAGIVKYGSGQNLSYKCENYRYDNSGVKSLRSYGDFIFVHRGDILEKRDFNTGAIIATVAIPGGNFINTTVTIPLIGTVTTRQVGCSGIDIDDCGNIYVGATNGVVKFNQSLVQQSILTTLFNVYDVHVSTSGDIIACGSTGTSSTGSRTGYIQSFAATACAPIATTCCDASICPINTLCPTDAPVTIVPITTAGGTWSASCGTCINVSTGTFDPGVAGAGTHTVTYTLGCGSEQINVVVLSCSLDACIETNGDFSAGGGTGPYTWSHTVNNTPITNQAQCEACGHTWFGFQCVTSGFPPSPVTTCNTPQLVQFATGTTITPTSNFPIQVADSEGNVFVINNAAQLQSCSSVPCPSITATISSQSNVSCNGGNNGAATVTANGGTGPYTYLWSPGALTGGTQSTLAAGTYSISITDAANCVGSASVTITQPAILSATSSTTPTPCGQVAGAASVSPTGGTAPYTYLWSTGGTGSSISNVAAGPYSVVVSDALGCETTVNVTINSANGPTLSTSNIVGVNCPNDANGTATVDATGGTAPYTYLWSPGNFTTATVNTLSGGSYTVTVTDAGDCVSSIVVDIPAGPAIAVTGTVTNTTCGAAVGGVNVSATGGTGTLTYLWNPDGQTTPSISNLIGGTYELIVTDANGCEQTEVFLVGVVGSLPLTVNPISEQITQGESVEITVSGGTTYAWSPSTGLSCTNCPNPTATPSVTTTYTVIATDDFGCTGTADVIIMVEQLCGDLFIPTIFSPNDDGLNDEECIMGGCIATMNFAIFNRWGEKVFETESQSQCWDGTYKGKKVNTGVYVYKFTAVLLDGTAVERAGNLNVVR